MPIPSTNIDNIVEELESLRVRSTSLSLSISWENYSIINRLSLLLLAILASLRYLESLGNNIDTLYRLS